MALPRVSRACLLLAVAVCLAYACGRRADAAVRELKVGYYAETCPGAEEAVREAMARALAREARSVASVMRLQFHDCFVASVMPHAPTRKSCHSPLACARGALLDLHLGGGDMPATTHGKNLLEQRR